MENERKQKRLEGGEERGEKGEGKREKRRENATV
jgi:hypothetical protein